MPAKRSGSMLSTVRLSVLGLRREPPRPLDDRQPGYEALFDYDTLFFDVFRSPDGRKIICLGPPLLNCEPFFADVRFRLNGCTHPLQAIYKPSQMHLQPSCRFELAVPVAADTDRISIELGGRSVTVPVGDSGCTPFEGRRVVVTMVKDTPIQWIHDWAQFNARIHGAESFILYNNGSTKYGSDDLRGVLDSLDAPGPHRVIDWDFPRGPGVGLRRIQDSFYCQPGGLDHARRRFCALSRSVLNCDVDELVVGPEGFSVFEEAEELQGPGLHIHGKWVELVGASNPDHDEPVRLRHRDFIFAQRKQSVWRLLGMYNRLLRTKWLALPANCDDHVDWTVHFLASPHQSLSDIDSSVGSKRFMYRHFRQLTTKDLWPRRRIKRYNPIKHMFDRDLRNAMQRAWGSDLETPDLFREFS